MSASADNQYEAQNDVVGGEVASGEAMDNDYKSRTGQSEIPVQADDKPIEDPIDPSTADSDAQLEADDKNAIDQSNIIDSRTRGAAKSSGTYQEPGDEEGMPPPSDGTSRIAQ